MSVFVRRRHWIEGHTCFDLASGVGRWLLNNMCTIIGVFVFAESFAFFSFDIIVLLDN